MPETLNTNTRIIVAAGLIRRSSDGKILVSKRMAGTHLADSWEFPGGKVEPGEDPQETVRRELMEELGVEVVIGDIYAVGQHCYAEREVILLVYEARISRGTPRCIQVADFDWLKPDEVVDLPLPPADEPVIDRLKRECL